MLNFIWRERPCTITDVQFLFRTFLPRLALREILKNQDDSENMTLNLSKNRPMFILHKNDFQIIIFGLIWPFEFLKLMILTISKRLVDTFRNFQ